MKQSLSAVRSRCRRLVCLVALAAWTAGCKPAQETAEPGKQAEPPQAVADHDQRKPAGRPAPQQDLTPEPPASAAADRPPVTAPPQPPAAATPPAPRPGSPAKPPSAKTAPSPPPTPPTEPTQPAVAPPGQMPAPPATLHKPVLVFSTEHEQVSRVKVGETMPPIELPDLDAQQHALSDLLSDKLTVVVFWSLRQALGRDQFQRLQRETLQPFQPGGVAVVAVNVGDEPDEVRQAYAQAKATFPCLLDKNKLAFSAIATRMLPRTYLLDRQGRILWMDIVYSRTTRRELVNAIHYFLLEPNQAEPAAKP